MLEKQEDEDASETIKTGFLYVQDRVNAAVWTKVCPTLFTCQ